MKLGLFVKSSLSTLATIVIVGGIVYAISYPSVTPTGETPGGKFRAELDKLWGAVSIDSGYMSTKTPTLSGNIATKGYVDAQVVNAGWNGLKVYKSDGVTLLGNFFARYPYPNGVGWATMSTEYVDLSGKIVLLGTKDMEEMTDRTKMKVYFQSNDCTGSWMLLSYYDWHSVYYPVSWNGKYICNQCGDVGTADDFAAYTLPNGDFNYTFQVAWGYLNAYNSYWLGTSCISEIWTITWSHWWPYSGHDSLLYPISVIKKCWAWVCKFK